MAASFKAAVASILICLFSGAQAALLLSRPTGDCLSPAVSSLNYNFYPDNYQLKSIQSAAYSSGLETTVSFCGCVLPKQQNNLMLMIDQMSF